MSDTGDQHLDARAQVQAVLQRSVADYGPAVLSNPTILEGICEDRLPEYPREASLITTAARFDVAAILTQQVPGVGPDAAVRLTASNLAESRSLDPDACVWVVSEFARALGHQVSSDLASTGSGAAPAPGPAPPAVSPSPLEAPTVLPGDFAPSGANPAEGSGPGVFDPSGAAGEATPTPKRPHPRRNLVVGGVVILAIGAGVLFAVDPFSSTSPYSTLARLIPRAVSGGAPDTAGRCTKPKLSGGAVAEYDCDTSTTSLPVGVVAYVLYPDRATLDTTYKKVLSNNSVSEGAGNSCGAFTGFTPPCETEWSVNHTNEGRVVEYNLKGSPTMFFTLEKKLLLVGIEGSSAKSNDMFQWWDNNNWIASGVIGG